MVLLVFTRDSYGVGSYTQLRIHGAALQPASALKKLVPFDIFFYKPGGTKSSTQSVSFSSIPLIR